MPGAEFLFGLIGAGLLALLAKLLKALGLRSAEKEEDA
jgi:hypothetical protein